MRADIEAAVIAILAAQALIAPTAIAPDAKIADLGLDSLAQVEAIFALEERFDIAIPFNANAPDDTQFDITSVQSIVTAVERLIAAQAA